MTAPRLVEQWTCAGRRRAAGSKRLSTAWVDAQGRQRLYAKVTGVVGGQYEVSVQHAGDTATVYGRPPFIRPADREPAEVGGWEVAGRP